MNLRSLPNVDAALRVMGDQHTKLHFSQFGEDIIVESMLGVFGMADRPGFYVDVGAHHPSYLSNTKLLNLRGWCVV